MSTTSAPGISGPRGRNLPAAPFVRSRARRSSLLTLLGSIGLHVVVLAVGAHYLTDAGGGYSEPAAADGGPELSMSVKIAAPVSHSSAQRSSQSIRRALPAQQQRVFAAAPTDFALPPPVASLDLPEARVPDQKTAPSAEPTSADAPPSKKVASSQTKKRGGGSTSKGSSGSGLGSGTASAPRPLSTRVPVYPYSAKKRGEEGMVLVRVRVNEAGKVASSSLYRSCGHAELDEAAVACVWKWNFAPGQSAGRAVESSAVVRVSFRLEG